MWEDDESPESGEKENWVLVVSFFGLSYRSMVREYLTLLGGDRPLAFLAAADDFAAENLDRKLDGVGSLLLAVEAWSSRGAVASDADDPRSAVPWLDTELGGKEVLAASVGSTGGAGRGFVRMGGLGLRLSVAAIMRRNRSISSSCSSILHRAS